MRGNGRTLGSGTGHREGVGLRGSRLTSGTGTLGTGTPGE